MTLREQTEALEREMRGKSRVTFYLLAGDAGLAKLAEVRIALQELKESRSDCGTLLLTLENVQDADWETSWKQYYKPLPIGERLLVVPQWEAETPEVQAASACRVPLILDPGLTFGTGSHATTRLCLTALERRIQGGERVLDLGCGSGILSVAGLLLGAGSAVGVDIDALAVKTAVANAEINHVGDKFTGICGNLADKVTGTFDVVVANIVADVVILLTKDAPRFMKPDTVYIMSGIIDTREDDVLACLADKFEIIDRKEEKGWVALAAKLK